MTTRFVIIESPNSYCKKGKEQIQNPKTLKLPAFWGREIQFPPVPFLSIKSLSLASSSGDQGPFFTLLLSQQGDLPIFLLSLFRKKAINNVGNEESELLLYKRIKDFFWKGLVLLLLLFINNSKVKQ